MMATMGQGERPPNNMADLYQQAIDDKNYEINHLKNKLA
jgi:hypothetical protein